METSLSPEIRRLIDEKVSSGRYRTADEVVRKALELLERDEEKGSAAGSRAMADLGAAIAAIAGDVPEAAWEGVPADLAGDLDRYLYGQQKTS